MIVAAHQPAFLPWLGYLDKIARADLFVVMDDLQYEAQNFQNRNRVKVNNGVAWLTVPLCHGPQDEPIAGKRIAEQRNNKEHWQRRSWLTLLTHYRRAPHFSRYEDQLGEVFHRRWERLIDLDVHLLRLLLAWLEIDCPMVMASSLSLQGQRSERIVHMCRAVGASTYLSGSGASRAYLEVERFTEAGVEVAWQDFHHPVYPQRYPARGFIPNLAAVDLVLNCGPESRRILLGGADAPSLARRCTEPERRIAG